MNDSTSFDGDGRQAEGWMKPARPSRVTLDDEPEFELAIEAYRNRSGRRFPTCCEFLEVIRTLGYSKRIWKPVGIWSPTSIGSPGNEGNFCEPAGIVGWFSRVETPLGP